MRRTFRVDLHVHTCLSPCADEAMTPRAIVERAVASGLNAIGICDHNAAANAPAVMRAAASSGLAVLPGLEITTREEVHILGLFETADDALQMQAFVWEHLGGRNAPEVFGTQWIVDEDGRVLEECPRLLMGATDLPLGSLLGAIHLRGGCAIAAHVDRERFGIVGQLGFIPPTLALDGLEHTPCLSRAEALARYGGDGRWELVCGSDAHRLAEIGAAVTVLEMKAPTATEVQRALFGEDGRRVLGAEKPEAHPPVGCEAR